ncbi:hypothetical protein P7B02_03035 [Caulobacter segnis]|uniref:hypothetical protein n=1 Tax=Caulobacter segnis TaxID=88688 RepID=UPI002410B037|nr:hypothetical protein [Caulobacter segnis]MDG2520504.1 hypothetical protein [Caulobacter segnis]
MTELTLELSLPPELAKVWAAAVDDAGGADEAFRRLLLMARMRSLRTPKKPQRMSELVVVNVPMSKRDALAAQKLAAGAGFKRAGWIRALVVSRLHARPQFSSEEMRLHAAVRYELHRIGCVLRATAQQVQSSARSEDVRLLLDAWADARSQLIALRSAMAGSLLYWACADD